ncbi:MAG: autotransporter-associated beta strand repeat-containing protein [Thermoguttaceae bacterium]|nr:autotransporter-associated beta strand repeat-containing protein [Thermoguttaceae bacterium]
MSNSQTGLINRLTRCSGAAIAFLAVLFACSYSSADITYTDSTIPAEDITTGSGGVGNVTFDITEAGAYSNVMSGAGKVTKTGDGTLTLSGANTFTGGLTISSGKILVTDGGSIGTTTKTTNNGGTLEFAIASGTTTINCNISNYNGTKTIKTGSGTLSTGKWISGLVEVQQGTLKLTNQLGDGDRRFSGTVTVANGATLEFGAKDSLGYQNSGTTYLKIYGTLNHSASKKNETLKRTQLQLYGGTVKSTGGTTYDFCDTNNAVYSYALDGATPENPTVSTISAVLNFRTTGTINFETAANSQIKITGELKTGSGSCSITKLGAGTLVISSKSSTFSGGLIVSAGKVIGDAAQSGGKSTFGSGSVEVASGATLEFQVSNQLGTGNSPNELTIKGIFIPSNYTHVGNITLENGVIEKEYNYGNGSGLDFGGRTATITSSGYSTIKSRLDIRNTSKVTIDVTSGNLTVEGVILDLTDGSEVGVGGFTKTGEGTLTLSGANTYKGTTAVSEGVLKLIDSGISTNGPITIAENANLEYNVASGTKNAEIGASNMISGAGSIVKTGDGVMQINAAEGAVDVQSLVVSSGRLDMKTYFTGSLEIGEELDGGYTIATFSPGNSIGTLNVDGDFILNPESTLLMEIGGETPDKNDSMVVSGAFTIGQNSIIYLALADDNNFTSGDTFEAKMQLGRDENDYLKLRLIR